jgi:hypothetical protein
MGGSAVIAGWGPIAAHAALDRRRNTSHPGYGTYFIMFPTVDHTPRLDVYALHHAGALVPGAVTTWRWPHPTAPLTVRVRAEIGRLCIAIDGGPEVAVAIERVPGTNGNDYPFLICGCVTRRYHLYVKEGGIACRACFGLRYACRHQYQWNPRLQRASRLRAKLVTTRRPMRSRRRRDTMAKIAECEAQAAATISAMLERLAKQRPQQ